MRAVVAAMLAAAAIVAPATAARAPLPGFAGCAAYTSTSPKLVVRPRSIVVACADGNFELGKIAWRSWGTSSATGTGVVRQNDCTPNCAAGHFHSYPAAVRLSAVRRCGGRREFTRVGWTFTRARPPGVPRSGSQTFRCR